MKLTVCCLAGAPGPRVRALIEPLREVADEVVIAADRRVSRDDLREYAAVADKLFSIEVVHSERHFAWLHHQCSGQWILRIDADEFASPELIAELPSLMANRYVRQYWIPRLWLYPDTAHWLNEPPWWPDYQLRLYRNDGFLRFSGLQHSTAVSQPPNVYVESPLYHLDLLVNNVEARERKANFYDELRPGLQAPGGGAMNERYYLPERAPSPLRIGHVVPNGHREAARILEARAARDLPDFEEPVVTTLAESDFYLDGGPFDPDGHRASIVPIEDSIRMFPDEQRALHFRVSNAGTRIWPWHNPEIDEGLQVRVGYHWYKEDGSVYEYEGVRTWLPCRLAPGESTVVPLMVQAPRSEGNFVLEVDLVHERWFNCGVRVQVPVSRHELAAGRRRGRRLLTRRPFLAGDGA
jgi:hypothetical protein